MVNVICPFCNHKQNTKSKLKNISCSSCRNKFPNTFYTKLELTFDEPEEKIANDITKEEKSLPPEGKKLKLD